MKKQEIFYESCTRRLRLLKDDVSLPRNEYPELYDLVMSL